LKIIVFTGAGASKPLGYPTTLEFFPKSGLDSAKQEVFNHLKKHLNTNIVDIEDALDILEKSDEFLNTSAGDFVARKLTDNWKINIKNFTSYCQERCFHLYGFIPEEKKVRELYLPLLTNLDWENNNISLFTTNYDPVTDIIMEIAEEMDTPAYDGFGMRGDWKPNKYAHNQTGLNIYRIHGSMSWIQQERRIKNTRDYSLRAVNNHEHLIIYPGFKGNPEDNSHEVFSFPHDQLRKQLKKADVLITIGFSFRDIHLNNIFKSSMEENSSLMLIIINPDWPSGLNGIMDSLKVTHKNRITHLNEKFGGDNTIIKLDNMLGGIRYLLTN